MNAAKELNGEVAKVLQERMKEVFAEVLERNANAIAHELITSEDGCGGVSVKFDFQMSNGAVNVASKITWSRKFEDKEEACFRFSDPANPELPGVEDEHDGRRVVIKSGDIEIDTSLGAIKRAGRRASKPRTEPEAGEN